MNFTDHYIAIVKRHIGRIPNEEDGIPESIILQHEERLGIRLPVSLREYYKRVGKLDELNKAHNLLSDLNQLEVLEGHLLFMEENQAVVHWGFALFDLGEADPIVWQRVNAKPPTWFSEEMSFSTFIKKMFDWQAGFEE